jgi:hypothetical protein
MKTYFIFPSGQTTTSMTYKSDSTPVPGKNVPEGSQVFEAPSEDADPNLYEVVEGKLQLIPPPDPVVPVPTPFQLLEKFKKDIVEDRTIEPDDTVLLLMLYDRLREGFGVVDIKTYWAKLKSSDKFPWLTKDLATKVEDHAKKNGIELA